ncbi:MAG TPA: MBOAT family protein [Acetobacteraceae bacterium]|nr:MBOAT family protein [Acetobacteraceae bacterium]
MLFNSQPFILVFLPLVLALYYAAAEHRALRQSIVIVASLVFYGWWDVRFVPLLAGLTVANWLVARAFGRWRHAAIPAAGVAMNLAALGFFKYASFLAGNVAAVFGLSAPHFDIVLPLGLSFFVFQKISYLIDLKRGDGHFYGFLDFCMFVIFFPQLIAGPLVRHNEIIPQFEHSPLRPEVWENLGRGLLLFTCGLVKKVALADTIAPFADRLFHIAATGGPLNAAIAWAAAGTYALQIYFDFSGYSDMAIGLARMFGLVLPINFDAPYRAVSIRDFWRRWHITLSRFLRDYLYIPLGGNRRGPARQAANVIATMLLGGLWHGAGWTFVAWGGMHGAALAANGAWDRAGLRMPRVLGWAVTLAFVVACWVLFRAPDFTTAGRMLTAMTGAGGIGHVKVDNAGVVVIAAALALLGPTSQELSLRRLPPARWVALPAGAALVAILLLVGGRIPNAFIYFQF